jgi:hypothetical protein
VEGESAREGGADRRGVVFISPAVSTAFVSLVLQPGEPEKLSGSGKRRTSRKRGKKSEFLRSAALQAHRHCSRPRRQLHCFDLFALCLAGNAGSEKHATRWEKLVQLVHHTRTGSVRSKSSSRNIADESPAYAPAVDTSRLPFHPPCSSSISPSRHRFHHNKELAMTSSKLKMVLST